MVSIRDYRPVLGIELDSSNHDRAEQQYRDAVKETVFRSAGLPLVRFKNEDNLSVTALRMALGAYL